jgi:hypothetical protein
MSNVHAPTSSYGGVFGGIPVYSTSGDFQHYAIAQLEALIHEVQRETLILENVSIAAYGESTIPTLRLILLNSAGMRYCPS